MGATQSTQESDLHDCDAVYQYTSLPDKDAIRLLRLTRMHDGKLSFELVTTTLRQRPVYEAVSYTWGDPERTHFVTDQATGRVLRIPRNSADVLENLADTECARILWIDAICINQDDFSERGAQVAIMDQIFQGAWSTIAYVGHCGEDFRLVTAACEELRHGPHLLGAGTRTGYYLPHFRTFLQRPWFSRTWVLQEVLLSSHIRIQAGQSHFNFQDLLYILVPLRRVKRSHLQPRTSGAGDGPAPLELPKMFELMAAQPDPLPFRRLPEAEPRAPNAVMVAKFGRQFAFWQLFDVLYATHELQCRDARDKVFAILSLFRDSIPSILKPDYTQTLRDTFSAVTRYLLQIDITVALSSAVGAEQQEGLPSWVIDWRSPPSQEHALKCSEEYRNWRAGFALEQRQVIATFDQPGVASLRGRRVYCIMALRPFSSKAWFEGRQSNLLSHTRQEMILSDGKLGLAPISSQVNDVVVVLVGFEVPFVLRRRPLAGIGWLLVGECYLEHIMEGQFLDDVDWSSVAAKEPVAPLEDFEIY